MRQAGNDDPRTVQGAVVSKRDTLLREYIVVTDRDSKVVLSGTYAECVRFANNVRKCGGEVTIFKATKG